MAEGKKHVSIVICGHVDAGKSTTTGRLIFELGGISEREMVSNSNITFFPVKFSTSSIQVYAHLFFDRDKDRLLTSFVSPVPPFSCDP